MSKGVTHRQKKRVWVAVSALILLLFAPCRALANPSERDALQADSINALAENPDFIRASLLIVEPGNKVYSVYGHAAIRLQNPANQLDYCFTFEMLPGLAERLKFLFATAKSGYATFPTEQFIEQYRQENRGITEYVLNLNPQQEQELWRRLDEELQRGPVWDYNFLTTNCSSMCVYIVEASLQDERLEYHDLHPALTGTYNDLGEYISRDSPWCELFWKLHIGRKKSAEKGGLSEKLVPELLPETWRNARLIDSTGNARPMITGEPVVLLPYSNAQSATLITPFMALLGLIIVFIIIILLFHFKKR